MAEGDTILRAARRIEGALGGQTVEIDAPARGRARAAGVERLDGRRLERVDARGKHLLLGFGDAVLHSHLGMNGSWQVGRRGKPWRKPAGSAWVVLRGDAWEAVQFGGPTLRVLEERALRRDPVLSRLGPDVLSADFDPSAAARSLARAPERELGDALLDQRLLAGVGNIFKSEACFAAGISPWRPVGDLHPDELQATLAAANRLMSESVESGRPSPRIYRRAGRPCPTCSTPIASRGQGDANRITYWCPFCQPDQVSERRAK